jgi:DNA polymerase-3 subunit delta
VTPSEAVKQAKQGNLLPVYVVAGEERLFRDDVVRELRAACLAGGVAAFNEDKFTAGDADVEAVISAARTVPMMARRRFVLLRGAERWDTSDDSEPAPRPSGRSGEAAAAFDRLAEYAAAPVGSTCLVMVASKLDRRRKLALIAKKQDFLVVCDPLDGRSLPAWICQRCAGKGNPIAGEVAELLAALAGPQLSSVDDAIERLSLYVGPGVAIDEAAVSACVARVRTADTWALVDAVGTRNLGRALRTLADAYDPRDRGLPLLGALA